MINVLNNLVGMNLSSLPFISSYLNKFNAFLLDANYSKGIITYLFDFNIEKLQYDDAAVPIRKIVHNKIECRHSMESNIIVITKNAAVEDKIVLGVASLIPHYLVMKTSLSGLPNYRPPKWQEISFSQEQLSCIGNIIGDMLGKGINAFIDSDSFITKLTLAEDSDICAIIAKPYRTNSFVIRLKYENYSNEMLITNKGEIKLNFLISLSIIDCLITSVWLIKLNEKNLTLLTPINSTTDYYFKIIHVQMLPEARIKLEKKILKDFLQLLLQDLPEADNGLNRSYIWLTSAFNILIRIASTCNGQYKASTNLSFSYEALSSFLIMYCKKKYGTILTENDIDIAFDKFLKLMKDYRYNRNNVIKLLASKDNTL